MIEENILLHHNQVQEVQVDHTLQNLLQDHEKKYILLFVLFLYFYDKV